jgi:hypothetical protein
VEIPVSSVDWLSSMLLHKQKTANVIVVASLLGSQRPLNKPTSQCTVNKRLTSCPVDGLKKV